MIVHLCSKGIEESYIYGSAAAGCCYPVCCAFCSFWSSSGWCVVGQLCWKDSWSGWRECQATPGDDRMSHRCAWPWFNEGQK